MAAYYMYTRSCMHLRQKILLLGTRLTLRPEQNFCVQIWVQFWIVAIG